jgi:hypothetical protein
MVAALPSLLNPSSSTIRLVELITWQWLLLYCTISSQPFLLYHQVSGADYMARVAENGSDHWRGWLLLFHLFSTIPPLPSG